MNPTIYSCVRYKNISDSTVIICRPFILEKNLDESFNNDIVRELITVPFYIPKSFHESYIRNEISKKYIHIKFNDDYSEYP